MRWRAVLPVLRSLAPVGVAVAAPTPAGVSEYWVVNPDLDVVRVYRNRDGRFDRPVELRADARDVLKSPHLGGLKRDAAGQNLRRVAVPLPNSGPLTIA